MTATRPTTCLGYTRVSTDDQAVNGAGLGAQASTIRAACLERGWELAELITDTESGATVKRPGIARAVAALDAGLADVLMVAKLDRLSRSLRDYSALVERAAKKGWQLVVLDAPVGTDTPMGEAMLGIMAVFAQLERRLIGQRTREALAAKRAAGVVLGRPRSVAPAVVARAKHLRGGGLSYQRIADILAAEGRATATGGKWHPSTVRTLCGYPADYGG